ncbi:MAG TPA: nucleoside deaminase [Pseudolabrys sp.]|nr:nucleoside deaminase [Pseudolabrys sp.]
MNDVAANDIDRDTSMMRRCIQLSAESAKSGELPFACVICDDEGVIAETTNQVRADGDVTRHAELVAISNAQRTRKSKILSGATLYSNVEPCPMCSFAIRETRIARVVYAISSPKMGGVSKWNILRDTELSGVMPEAFGPVPEVVAGLLWQEAAKVWRKWNPLAWGIIRRRGCFGPAPLHANVERMQPARMSQGWLRSLLMLHG